MRLLLSDVLSRELMDNFKKYLELVTKASNRFTEALKLLNEIRIAEAKTLFSQVVKILDESSIVKSQVEDEVAKMRLDPGLKEELLVLISLIDDVGDSVKEASREFTIMPFLELPVQIRAGLMKLSFTVSDMISKLSLACSFFMNGEYENVEKLLKEIILLEEIADNIETENRSLLLTLGDKLKPIAMQLLVHDINSLLESTADLCTRVMRRLKLIVLAWLS